MRYDRVVKLVTSHTLSTRYVHLLMKQHHDHLIPRGRIEMLHESRDTPLDAEQTARHYTLEGNAKGLLVLTESSLFRDHSHNGDDAPRLAIYEIAPEELISLIRERGS